MAARHHLILCFLGILLLLCAGIGAGAESDGLADRNRTVEENESGEGNVQIVSPGHNDTFARTDIVPIKLAFEDTDVATLTFGDRYSPQNLEIDLTVRDVDGDGKATVYLNPLQIGDGARLSKESDEGEQGTPVGESCESRNASLDDCEQLVTPGDSRNHGFHTVGNETTLVGSTGTTAVAFGDGTRQIAGSKGRAVIFPQPYDLRVTSGSDSYRIAGVDSASRVDLKQKQIHDSALFTAPRTGPEAIDPTTAADLRAGLGQGTIELRQNNTTVTDDQYAILAFNVTGLAGGLHEAAIRDDSANASEILTRQTQNVTEAAQLAFSAQRPFGNRRGGLLWMDLSTTEVGPFDLELDSTQAVDRVIATTDGTDHYRRLYIFLEPRAGTALTRNESRLLSGMQLQTSFGMGWYRDGGNYIRNDFLASGNVTWQFQGPPPEPPTATIERAPESPSVYERVRFEAASSPLNAKYEWTLGDGSTDSGQIAGHTYNEPGEYTVTLTVHGVNETTTTSKTVTVTHAGPEPTHTQTEIGSDITPTPTDTPIEPQQSPGPATDTTPRPSNEDGAGFGVVLAVVLLVGGGYLATRR